MSPRENLSTTLESSDPEVFSEGIVHLQIFQSNYAHGEIHSSVVIKHTKHYGEILLFQPGYFGYLSFGLSFKPVDPYLGLHLAYHHAVFQRSPVIRHNNLMPANYTQS
jgi:hypothetical protein